MAKRNPHLDVLINPPRKRDGSGLNRWQAASRSESLRRAMVLWPEQSRTGFVILLGSVAAHGPFATAAQALAYANRHFRFLGWSLVELRVFAPPNLPGDRLARAIRADLRSEKRARPRSGKRSSAGKGRAR